MAVCASTSATIIQANNSSQGFHGEFLVKVMPPGCDGPASRVERCPDRSQIGCQQVGRLDRADAATVVPQTDLQFAAVKHKLDGDGRARTNGTEKIDAFQQQVAGDDLAGVLRQRAIGQCTAQVRYDARCFTPPVVDARGQSAGQARTSASDQCNV